MAITEQQQAMLDNMCYVANIAQLGTLIKQVATFSESISKKGGNDTSDLFNDINNNLAGAKVFAITAVGGENNKEITVDLSSLTPEELSTFNSIQAGARCCVDTSTEQDNIKIVSVDGATGKIVVENTVSALAVEDDTIDGDPVHRNYILILDYPNLGNTYDKTINAHAEGENTQALARGTHSEGRDSKAIGQYAHSEGLGTMAGYGSHSEGRYTKALGNMSHSEGHLTNAYGHNSHSEGRDTTATGYASHAEGNMTEASGVHSHSEGIKTKATGESSHAEGSATEASGAFSHSEGRDTIARGDYSHTEGKDTIAHGNYSHAEGVGAKALNKHAHAEGANTQAKGEASHAEGGASVAEGYVSHAEGNNTIALGAYSHTEGNNTKATGVASHVEGNQTEAGLQAHAEGDQTKATGETAHAEGRLTKASGASSHAEGKNTKATGDRAHAEGMNTKSTNESTHSEGIDTEANGRASHSEGTGTIANGENQHTQGKYNAKDTENKYAHIIGNGTSDTARSNAHTIDWDGNGWFAGDVEGVKNGTTHKLSEKANAADIANKVDKIEGKSLIDENVADSLTYDSTNGIINSSANLLLENSASVAAYNGTFRGDITIGQLGANKWAYRISPITGFSTSVDVTCTSGNKVHSLANKADSNDVLTKTNTAAFTPTADYQPATKKYVDDIVIEAGGGDMLRTVYDKDNDGIIDDVALLQYYGTTDITISDSSYFTMNETGETIIGLTDAGKTQTELVIPYEINGVKITTLCSGSDGISGSPVSILNGNNTITKVVIPKSVTTLGGAAFYNCSSLASINIPNGVTSIENYAFVGCRSLKSIDIPNSVTSIESGAFNGCSSLTSITIPNSVTSIGDGAFSFCSSLKSIDIPNSVTSIENYAFQGCRSLKSIDIPNSVTSIAPETFKGCTSLTSINIPNSVTSIGDYVFQSCTSLASITIPNSVTSIENGAFAGCSSNLTIYCEQGSYAETFAKSNNIPVVYTDIDPSKYLTKDNTQTFMPTADYHPATKKYVDDKVTDLPIKSLEGQKVKPTPDTEVTANTGATIIGDMRNRVFNSSGIYSGNVATGRYAVALGACNNAIGNYSIAGGLGNKTTGQQCVALGQGNEVSSSWSVALGGQNKASGNYAVAFGASNTAEGNMAVACGYGSSATAAASFATGTGVKATGENSIAAGKSSQANGKYSVAMGYNAQANESAVALGTSLKALDFQTKIGKYAKDGTAGVETDTTGDAFIIGGGYYTNNGTVSITHINAFRVTYEGKTYGLAAYSSSGADYAEYFEWKDGNPNNEDRRGRLVTLDGEKIRLATADDDYILGVVSANPCVEGDIYSDDWQGKYLTDVFGQRLTQTVHIPARYEEQEIADPETGETTTENVLIEDEHDAVQWVLNPDYDPEQEYVSREDRKEWSAIGLMGKLVVIDDGTCEVNGFCKAGANGIATKSRDIEGLPTNDGYRVMARIDENHIKVLVK